MTTARHLAREDTHCNAVVAASFFHLGSLIGHETTTRPAIVEAVAEGDEEEDDDDSVGSSAELLQMMTDSDAPPGRSTSEERHFSESLRCGVPHGSTSVDDMRKLFGDSAERMSQKRRRPRRVSGAFATKEEETTLEGQGQWKRQQSVIGAEEVAEPERQETDKGCFLESVPHSVPLGNLDLPSYTATPNAKRRVIAKFNGASDEVNSGFTPLINNSKNNRTEDVLALSKQCVSRPKIMLAAAVAAPTELSSSALGQAGEKSGAETKITSCVSLEATIPPPLSSAPSTVVLPSSPRKSLSNETGADEERAGKSDGGPPLMQQPLLTEVGNSAAEYLDSGTALESPELPNRRRMLRGAVAPVCGTTASEITSPSTEGATKTERTGYGERATDCVEKTEEASENDDKNEHAHVNKEHDESKKHKQEKQDNTLTASDENASLDAANPSSFDTSFRSLPSSPYGANIAAAAAAVLTQEKREALLSSIQQLVRGYVETTATATPADPIATVTQQQDLQQRQQLVFPSRCWGGSRKTTKALKQKIPSVSGLAASGSLPATSMWTPCLPPPVPPSLAGQRTMANSDGVSKADAYGSAFQGRATNTAALPFVMNSGSCHYLDADRFLAASSSRPLLRESGGVTGSSPVAGGSGFQGFEGPAVSNPPFQGFSNDMQAFRKQTPSVVVGVGAGVGIEKSEQPSEGATSDGSFGGIGRDINEVSRRAASSFEFVSGAPLHLRPDLPPPSTSGKEGLDISTRAGQVIADELLLQKRRKAEERLLELQRESISVARFLKETQGAEQQLQQTRLFQTVPWAEGFSVKNPSTVPVPFPPPLAPTPPHLSTSSSSYTTRTAATPSSMAVTSAPFSESKNNLDAGVGAAAVAAKHFHRTRADQAVTRPQITTPSVNNNSNHNNSSYNANRVTTSNSNSTNSSIMNSGTIAGFIPLKPPSDAIVCSTGVLESHPSSPDSNLPSVESHLIAGRLRPGSPATGGQSPATVVLQHAHQRHQHHSSHEASTAAPPIGGARCVPPVFLGTGPIITTGGRRPTDSFSGCCLGCACPLLSGQFVQCTVTACQRGFCHDCLAIAHAALAGRSEVLFAKEEQRCGVCSYQSKRRPTVPQREWHFEFHDAEDLRFAHRLRAALRHRSGLFIEIHHARPPCWRQKSGGKRCHYSFRFYGGIFESRLKAIFQQDTQTPPTLQHPLSSRTGAHLASQRFAHSFPAREGFVSPPESCKLSVASSTSFSPGRGFLGSKQNTVNFDSQSSVGRTTATVTGGSASSCCASPLLDPPLTRKGTGPLHSESAPVTPNLMDIGENNCNRRSASPPAGSIVRSDFSGVEISAPFSRPTGYENSSIDKARQASSGGYRASESAAEDVESATTRGHCRRTGSFSQEQTCSELSPKQRAWWLAGLRFLEDAMGFEEGVSKANRSPQGTLSSSGGILKSPMTYDGQGLSEAAEKLLKLSLALSQEAENRKACLKTDTMEVEDVEDLVRLKEEGDSEDDEEDDDEEGEECIQIDEGCRLREGQLQTRSEGQLEDEVEHRPQQEQQQQQQQQRSSHSFVPSSRHLRRTSSSSSGRPDISLVADSLLLREILSRSGLSDFPACLSPVETHVNPSHTALPCSPRSSSGVTGSNRAAVRQSHPFTALKRQAALAAWARLRNEAQGGKRGEGGRACSDMDPSDTTENVEKSDVCSRATPSVESASSPSPSSSIRRDAPAPSSSSSSSSSFYSLVSAPLPFTSSHHAPGASVRSASSSSSSSEPPLCGLASSSAVSPPMYLRASSPTSASSVQLRQPLVADPTDERRLRNSGGGDCVDIKTESSFSFSELRTDT